MLIVSDVLLTSWIWIDTHNYEDLVCVSPLSSSQVNENFAIDLIAEQPVIEVDHRIIACDGGGGALGHPKVYINLVWS